MVGVLDDPLVNLSRGGVGLEGQVASDDTSDERGGHRGTRDSLDGAVATDPRASDEGARSEDVEAATPVGERSTLIGLVAGVIFDFSSTDSDGTWDVGGGGLASISVFVTSGNSEGDAGSDGSLDGFVDSIGDRAAQRHVSDGRLAAGDGGVGDPFNAANDAGVGTRAIAVQDLNGNDGDLLGNTIGRTTDGTSDVSAVAVAIIVVAITSEVDAPDGTAGELGVSGQDTSVDDISINASSVAVVDIAAVQVQFALRNTIETPDGVGLGVASANLSHVGVLVLLDIANVRVSGLGQGILLGISKAVGANSEAVEVRDTPVVQDRVAFRSHLASKGQALIVSDGLVHYVYPLVINLACLSLVMSKASEGRSCQKQNSEANQQ